MKKNEEEKGTSLIVCLEEEKGTSLIVCLGNAKVGYDNNADDDIDDGGDDLVINDAFDATTMGFTYDAECARRGSVKGNLTDNAECDQGGSVTEYACVAWNPWLAAQ